MSTINNEIFCDTEDRYLKIYYPDSEKFVEFPLDDEDGKLLFIDVKVVEPNIFALNLIKPNNGGGKLYKPKNGCFKEPKEKWSYFKVIIVLKPSVNAISAKSSISDTCSNINQLLSTNVISTENVTVRENKKVQHFTENLPTPSIQSPIDSTLSSIENGSKKEKSKNIIQTSPTPTVQSINDLEIITSKESCFNAEIRDAEIFAAYNVSSLNELKELLCDRNPIFYESFAVNLHLWKETIMSNSSNLNIIKILFYAFYSNILLRTLDPNISDYCKICNKKFTLNHLVGKWHVNKYHSIYNEDPPEISIILKNLNPDNFVHFIPTDALCEMNIFSNNWYDINAFETFQKYIIHRIKEAQLYFSFKDPLFIEKLLFLNETFMQFPKLKDIFPKYSYCIMCNKNLQSFSCVMSHLLSKDHITKSLTQNELDKLVYAVSFINYSDIDGYYYNSVISTEKRKRSHPKEIALETPSKRHIIFSDSDS